MGQARADSRRWLRPRCGLLRLGDLQSDESHLHVWGEVFRPGAGWRGFDPTHGLAVNQTHIALAAGPQPVDAAPVTGTFRGTGATVALTHEIDIAETE